MSITRADIEQRDDAPKVTVMRLAGELDAAGMTKIQKLFHEIVEKHAPYVVAEMSGVSLFTSSALGTFMGFRTRLVEKGGDLVFAGLSIEVKAKLNLLGAGRIFKMNNDMQSAINAYRWDHEFAAQKLSLSFPSQLRFVPAVRQLISRVARQKNFTNRDSFRIEAIVDEVCNNAVEHGDKESKRNVDLDLNIDREKVEIRVVNATNPEKVELLRKASELLAGSGKPSLETERGRGLALVKMLANDLRIDFSNGGTCVHVTRRRGE
jgi:anti-anti-sigma factor